MKLFCFLVPRFTQRRDRRAFDWKEEYCARQPPLLEHQKRLVDELKRQFPKQLMHVPALIALTVDFVKLLGSRERFDEG
jgi:hypothetical protein